MRGSGASNQALTIMKQELLVSGEAAVHCVNLGVERKLRDHLV